MSLTPEGKVKRMVSATLKAEKVWHYYPINNGLGRGGIPDIVSIVDGMFLGIECKAGSRQPTPLQKQCMGEIEEAGGTCFVVRGPDSMARVEEWIISQRGGSRRC